MAPITAAFASITSDTATNGTQIPWLRQYYSDAFDLEELKGLANLDTDSDQMHTWKEYWSKTDPTDSNKFLRFTDSHILRTRLARLSDGRVRPASSIG